MHLATSDLAHLLATYGYGAVFFFVFIESMGIPVPGETMLIAAAVYAGSTHRLNIVLVVVAAAAGAILGDNAGYFIGREGGYRLLARYGRYIRVRDRELKLGQYVFLRHGGKVVFFGRFVSILRTYAAFLAGVNRMAWPRFVLYNAAGGILWASLYGTGAFILGKNIDRFTGPVGIGLGAAAAVAVVGFLIFLRRNIARLEDEAERALPGPLSPDTDSRPSPEDAHPRDAASGMGAGQGGHGKVRRRQEKRAGTSHPDSGTAPADDRLPRAGGPL
jgi:membrane protein DedA with SNARE-associated domain